MKKIFIFIAAFAMAFSMGITAFADESYIFDYADLLTESEEISLNEKAQAVAEETNTATYVLTVEDMAEYGYYDAREFAEAFYNENSLGLDEEKNGLLVMLSMADRDYAFVTYGGFVNTTLYESDLDTIEDSMLDDFGYDDWYGGFYDFMYTVEDLLLYREPYAAGNQEYYGYEVLDEEDGYDIAFNIGVGVIVGLAAALCVCLVLKGQMKSVQIGAKADRYVGKDGFRLTARSDNFSHITQIRNRIKTNTTTRGGGGGVRMSSGGFGGRSGKF